MKTKHQILCWIASLIAFLIFFILLNGCNSLNRVLKDPYKKEIVGREWEKENPCFVDTIITVKKDTVTKLDTLYKILNDTVVIDGKTKIIVKHVPELVTKTIVIKDSIFVDKTDLRRLSIALDSANYYKGLSQQFKAKYDQQVTETKNEKLRGNKWKLYFYLLWIIPLILFIIYKLISRKVILPF